MQVFEDAVAVIRRLAVGLFAIMAAHLAVHGRAFAGDTDPQQILAPAGKLRVGLYPGTPTSIGPGYLIPAGSPIAILEDIDRRGVRVGVIEKSSSDAALSHDLKNALIIRTATVKIGIEMLAARQRDAYAKATLFEMADALPGSKVLDGQWGVEKHAVAIPKGREQGMAFVQKFSKDVKTEGLVTAAIERAGLRGTVALEAK
jgi:hypothetical protein